MILLRIALLGVIATSWLTGCATTAVVPRELGRSPNEEEQRMIDSFASRVVEAARLEGFRCDKVVFVITDMPNDSIRSIARPSWNPCAFYMQVDPRYLRVDTPIELAGTLAHELGHVMNGDWTPKRASVPQIERERQADAISILILGRMGASACRAQIEHFRKIRAANIRAWGVEQRDTIATHPSYTERIRVFEAACGS